MLVVTDGQAPSFQLPPGPPDDDASSHASPTPLARAKTVPLSEVSTTLASQGGAGASEDAAVVAQVEGRGACRVLDSPSAISTNRLEAQQDGHGASADGKSYLTVAVVPHFL